MYPLTYADRIIYLMEPNPNTKSNFIFPKATSGFREMKVKISQWKEPEFQRVLEMSA